MTHTLALREQPRVRPSETGADDIAKLPHYDLANQRFGDWLALKHTTNGKWYCVCVCGVQRSVNGSDLRTGKSKGCGCRKARECSERLTQHGLATTPEYFIWHGMIRRCQDENATHYSYYGGRGIRVCQRWRKSFEAFIKDMGFRPTTDHTIDRIDPDGDYEPNNCRWVTRRTQQQNTRGNHNLTYQGQTLCVSEWARRLGLNRSTLNNRLQRGWSVEQALTTPKRER